MEISRLASNSRNNFSFNFPQIFLPHSDLGVEVMETRFGGLDNLQTDPALLAPADHVGPVRLTIPNLGFDFNFELSRPLQSFGVIKMFNDGFSRLGFAENLIAGEAWHRATFESRWLRESFGTGKATGKVPAMNISCNRPFFVCLKDSSSDVIQVFGYIKQHSFFNSTES